MVVWTLPLTLAVTSPSSALGLAICIVIAGDYGEGSKYLTEADVDAFVADHASNAKDYKSAHDFRARVNLYAVASEYFADISLEVLLAMVHDTYIASLVRARLRTNPIDVVTDEDIKTLEQIKAKIASKSKKATSDTIMECPKCGAIGSQVHAPGCSSKKYKVKATLVGASVGKRKNDHLHNPAKPDSLQTTCTTCGIEIKPFGTTGDRGSFDDLWVAIDGKPKAKPKGEFTAEPGTRREDGTVIDAPKPKTPKKRS